MKIKLPKLISVPVVITMLFLAICWLLLLLVNPQRNLADDFVNQNKINLNLAAILNKIPTAARVRIGLVHSVAKLNSEDTPIFTFTVVNAVTRHGFRVLPLTGNAPLSQWSDIIDSVIDQKCIIIKKSDLKDPESILRMTSYGINAALVCPMITIRNNVVGVVMVSWDDKQPLSEQENLNEDTKILQQYTKKLAIETDELIPY